MEFKVTTSDTHLLSPQDRLSHHGLVLPATPTTVGIYVPAVRSGQLIYTSGQLPWADGELLHPGKVGENISVEQAMDAARQCALNAVAAVRSQTSDLGKVIRVVKVTGFVSSAADFTDQSLVINGASQLLGEVFGDEIGSHVRSAVGVAALPLNSCVEMEITVEVEA